MSKSITRKWVVRMEDKHFIVFDLEATCDERGGFDNETIQIGAVKVDAAGKFIDKFECFIKPITNPILTPFCTQLTGIDQKLVDAGILFPEAFEGFLKWAGKNAVFCSWGYYDRKQLMKDCDRHNLPLPLLKHISLKHQYALITHSNPKGMKEVLRREGLVMEGMHHNGLDDALNIVKIFVKYLGKWRF